MKTPSKSQLAKLLSQLNLSALLLAALVPFCMAQDSDVSPEIANDDPVFTITQFVEPIVEEALPKQALTSDLLSNLLLMYLAAYEGEWDMALEQGQAAALGTDDPRVARIATILAVQNKNYTDGVRLAERWLELESNAQDALNLLLISLVHQGQIDAALGRLDTASKLSKEAITTTSRWLAGLMVRQGNGPAALQLMESVIKRHESLSQVYLSSAYVADVFNQHDQAQMWLSMALELQPGWEPAAQLKAKILERQNRPAERARFIKEFVKAHPKSTVMRVSYAFDLARLERYGEAMEQLEKVLKVDHRNEQALTYAGMVSRALGKKREAQKYYRRLLEVAPQNESGAWELAELAVEEGQYSSAERYFEQIVSEKAYLSAQLRVATTRVHTQGVDAAIEVLRNLEPNTEQEFVDVALTRHYILQQAHRDYEALGYINETLLYVPDDDELLYARAGVAAQLGDIKIAETDYRRLLATDPDNPELLNALGYTLADQTERYEEALILIEKALDLKPDSAHIIDSFGWVKYKLGELDQAKLSLEKAYAISAEPEIGIHLAEVLWQRSDKTEALNLWKAIAEQNPSHPLLLSTLTRLGVDLNTDSLAQRPEE